MCRPVKSQMSKSSKWLTTMEKYTLYTKCTTARVWVTTFVRRHGKTKTLGSLIFTLLQHRLIRTASFWTKSKAYASGVYPTINWSLVSAMKRLIFVWLKQEACVSNVIKWLCWEMESVLEIVPKPSNFEKHKISCKNNIMEVSPKHNEWNELDY